VKVTSQLPVHADSDCKSDEAEPSAKTKAPQLYAVNTAAQPNTLRGRFCDSRTKTQNQVDYRR
jgi:hypothetical protein